MTEEKTTIQTSQPIAFAEKFASKETFLALFQDGMKLVEQTAAYLDGPGRAESRALSRTGSLTYTSESMRLTTRLMQLASWLLLQRAVREGEISYDQAVNERNKVNLTAQPTEMSGPRWDELPTEFQALVAHSQHLQERVRMLDAALTAAAEEDYQPVQTQVSRDLSMLAQAFGGRLDL